MTEQKFVFSKGPISCGTMTKTEVLTDEKRQGSNSMRAAERMKRGVMKKKMSERFVSRQTNQSTESGHRSCLWHFVNLL